MTNAKVFSLISYAGRATPRRRDLHMHANILARLSLKLVAASLLAACSAGRNEDVPTTVSYADTVAAGTVQDYMNADWLFKNYFEEYGAPSDVKPDVIQALQMLANGFALQLKTGQDVKRNIEQMHCMFLLHIASGQASLSSTMGGQSSSSSNFQIEAPENGSSSFIPPVISAEDQAAIRAAKQRDVEERLATEKIARELDLPYRIEGLSEQWIIYSPTMKRRQDGG